MNAPRISVVIPVKNELAKIKACLDGVFSQTLKDQLEVIAVDSGSTDGTLAVLAQYRVTVKNIPPGEFNHGDTRNLGVRLARGEFVVMTVADAAAVDNRWLERMLQHFSDPRVMGVCGQQIVPHDPDKNPFCWFHPWSPPEARRVWFKDPADFMRLSAQEQRELCAWDDVTVMYRRSALLALPFRRVSFCEDVLWAKEALSRGYALVYEPRAQVTHYHRESFSFRFRRTFTERYFCYRTFSYLPKTKSLFRTLIKTVYHLVRNERITTGQKLKWMAYNFRLDFAEWLAAYYFSFLLRTRGDEAITRIHENLCGRPPQAIGSLVASPNNQNRTN